MIDTVAGAEAGTAAAPGLGTAIGAITGIALIAVDIVPYGEPHITMAERLKGVYKTVFKEAWRDLRRVFG